jgi:DNA-binding LytR/AlgR family response regulator
MALPETCAYALEVVDQMADVPTDMKGPTPFSMHAVLRGPATHLASRIGLKVSGKILLIDPSEIIAVHAERNYVSLRRESESYFVRESISNVGEKLQGYGFIRIHNSVLVNTFFVEEVRPQSTGEYSVRVKGGKEYTVTRTYKKNLASLAALWIGSRGFGEFCDTT